MSCHSYEEAEAWSLKTQDKKGDCLATGYTSSLLEKVCIDLKQNDLSQLADIWKKIKETKIHWKVWADSIFDSSKNGRTIDQSNSSVVGPILQMFYL